jgi:prephenate dehydratase
LSPDELVTPPPSGAWASGPSGDTISSVGYQGEPGAYSEEAASALFPGAQSYGQRTFAQAFDALSSGSVDAVVLPVENSVAGIVQEVNDLLWQLPGLRVRGEHIQPVVHCLLGHPGEPVRAAMSHPQALAQCRVWLETHGIVAVPVHDTAGAARQLAESPEPGLAAIASAAAARRYGLRILADGIQDDSSNRTRFLVIDRGTPDRPRWSKPGDKSSLAFIGAHRPGSLVAALQCFSTRGVNLTRLDSRPLRERPFEYRFYLDFEIDDPMAAETALNELEQSASEVRLFGTYPAAGA